MGTCTRVNFHCYFSAQKLGVQNCKVSVYLQQGPVADENIKMRSILSHISTSLTVLLKDFCNFPLVIDVERIICPLWEAERNNTTRSTNVQVTSSAPGTFPDVKGEIMVKLNVFCRTVMGRLPRTTI